MSTPTADRVQLVELGREECLQLLAANALGRIATGAAGWPPVIRPVHYVFDERTQSVVFVSAPGSKLTMLLRSNRVAFEIDGWNPIERTGWSVIVVGPVEEVRGRAERERLGDGFPHLMRIRATVVTGRRIEPG